MTVVRLVWMDFSLSASSPEVSDVIGLVFGHVHGQVALGHLAQDAAHVVDGLPQTAADPVGGLGDPADLIGPAVEGLQLLIIGEIQVAQPANGPLHNHQLPALPPEDQKGDEDNRRGHGCAQHAHQDAHRRDGGVDLRGVVPDHKDPAPVLQILIVHQLTSAILVPVGVGLGVGGAVGLDAADDLLVPRVGGLGVEQSLVLVIEVDAVLHI